jgi:hypothetical protein
MEVFDGKKSKMERMRKSTIGGGGGQFDDNYWSYSKSCIKHPLTVSLTDPQMEEKAVKQTNEKVFLLYNKEQDLV